MTDTYHFDDLAGTDADMVTEEPEPTLLDRKVERLLYRRGRLINRIRLIRQRGIRGNLKAAERRLMKVEDRLAKLGVGLRA